MSLVSSFLEPKRKKRKKQQPNILQLLTADVWKLLCIPKEFNGQPLLSLNELLAISMTSKEMLRIVRNNIPWNRFSIITRSPYKYYLSSQNTTLTFDKAAFVMFNRLRCCVCTTQTTRVVPISWCHVRGYNEPLCWNCWKIRLHGETAYPDSERLLWPHNMIRIRDRSAAEKCLGYEIKTPVPFLAKPGSRPRFCLLQEQNYLVDCVTAAVYSYNGSVVGGDNRTIVMREHALAVIELLRKRNGGFTKEVPFDRFSMAIIMLFPLIVFSD